MSVERKKRKERCCARWQMLLRSMTMGRKHWAERPLLAQNLLHSSLSLPVSLVAVAIPSPLRARPRSGVPKPKIENHPTCINRAWRRSGWRRRQRKRRRRPRRSSSSSTSPSRSRSRHRSSPQSQMLCVRARGDA